MIDKWSLSVFCIVIYRKRDCIPAFFYSFVVVMIVDRNVCTLFCRSRWLPWSCAWTGYPRCTCWPSQLRKCCSVKFPLIILTESSCDYLIWTIAVGRWHSIFRRLSMQSSGSCRLSSRERSRRQHAVGWRSRCPLYYVTEWSSSNGSVFTQ